LLDDLAAPGDLVRQSLHHLARSNRWFGGKAAVWHGIARLVESFRGSSLTLLDVGTGAGDIPLACASLLRRRGLTTRIHGLERHPVCAKQAREAGLHTVLGDGRCLPFADRAVDLVLASQVVHHLPPAGVIQLAREATRVARLGVVIADLRPSRGWQWGFRIASGVLGFDRATREDGIISLRRGFRPGDLRPLLEAAGARPIIRALPMARIVAYWSTD